MSLTESYAQITQGNLDMFIKNIFFIFIFAICSFISSDGFAERKISYITDTSFKLGNKKFDFSNVGQEEQKIHKMFFDSTGGILLVGTFTKYAGKKRTRILRLLPTLKLDPTFNPNIDGEIIDAALAPDGKIFIGGDFTTVDGVSRNGIARLLSTGGIDTSFDPLTGANGTFQNVTRVMPFSDGSVVIFGNFSRVAGILASESIAKLSSTGSVDTTFTINLLTATLNDGTRSISAYVCELMPNNTILVFGFGSDTSNPSTDGFQGSTIINSDGTRTENIKAANELLQFYHHGKGSYLTSPSYGFISHEVFDSQISPISETLYRFDTNGLIDPSFKIKKDIYFTAVTVGTDGKFYIAAQSFAGKKKIISSPLFQRFSSAGKLEATYNIPKLKNTNFEYKNILPLPKGKFLVQVRTFKESNSVGTGRVFTNFLIKVKKK